jgi:hypothetical protein
MPETRTSTERLAMLLACGSPGSAMAYHGLTPRFEADLLQRNQVESTGMTVATVPPRAARPSVIAAWISRLVRPFREPLWQRELRDREAYLAGAQNISDLEVRMRTLERATLSRGRALG